MSALKELLSGYFNQDWILEGPTADAILDAFVANNPPDDVREAYLAVRDLLRQDLPEAELRSILDEAGMDYDPERFGMTNREFLGLVAARLERAT